MFIGQYEYNLDEKGRVSIPGKFREKLPLKKKETTLVVAQDLANCLAVYPKDAWAKAAEKIQNLPRVEDASERLVRFFFSTAEECLIDKQGRILLSPDLRRHAGLEREIVFLGNYHKFEIWNRDAWRAEEAINASPETRNQMKQLLLRFGF